MNGVVKSETSVNAVGITTNGSGSKIAPENLGDVIRFAEVMARADIALPKHLRSNPGACMAVAMQALEWEMSPFAVASKSYSVNGTIAYEAQLIAAVVNTRSGITGRLKYAYTGEKANLVCTVTGVIDGDELVYESPPFSAITPKNSPLWNSDPRQQLGYYSSRAWARRFTPEVLLGVYDREEAEQFQGPAKARDVTPQTSLAKQIAARQTSRQSDEAPQELQDGFNADFVEEQTRAIKDAPQDEADPIEETPQSPPSPGDGEAEPDSVASNTDDTGSAEPRQLYPYTIAQELIASLKALKTEKQISNTWSLQFEKRAEQLDSDDRRDMTEITKTFVDFVVGKVDQIGLDNLCEDLLAEISERQVQPADEAVD